jgi:predicted NAD/FAD-binding protein
MAKRVAVVGSGCSGLAAVWALTTSTCHEVHLFESDSRLGGQFNTVVHDSFGGENVEVDTNIMMVNAAASPNLLRFLEHLDLPAQKADASLGFSRDQGTFEWATTSFTSMFAQKRNIFGVAMWRMLFDIVRFNEFAPDLLQQVKERSLPGNSTTAATNANIQTVADYLRLEDYSQEFCDNYLIPLIATCWKMSPDACLLLPARLLVRFMLQHNLLNFPGRPSDWLSIAGGWAKLASVVLKSLPVNQVHLQTKVTALTPTKRGSVILTANDKDRAFDHVVLAIPADQALELLDPVANSQEYHVLRGVHTSRNVAVLHADSSLMPRRRKARAALNYLTESPFPPGSAAQASAPCVTYQMNLFERIPVATYGPVLLTLNPLSMPNPKLVQGIWEYSHAVYDEAAVKSQKLLPTIQNVRGISFCGAWTGHGFHEDALTSGLSVAVDHLGATLPFVLAKPHADDVQKPTLTIRNSMLRLAILLVQIASLLLERMWHTLCRTVDGRMASRRKAI